MKIRIEDSAAIAAALSAANGKCRAHTITTADEIMDIAGIAEKRLNDARLNLDARVGTQVTFRPEGPGKQYAKKSAFVTTTRITLVRKAHSQERRAYETFVTRLSGWFLVGVERVDIHATSDLQFDVTIPQSTADEIMRKSLAGFKVAA